MHLFATIPLIFDVQDLMAKILHRYLTDQVPPKCMHESQVFYGLISPFSLHAYDIETS